MTEKAPEKPTEKVPEPEQTSPWEEPPAEKAPDKLDEVAAQGRQLEISKSSDYTILNQYYKGDFDHG